MTESDETLKRRIFTSGYMLGKKHGYDDATVDSYPELEEGQTYVGRAVNDAIQDYLNPHQNRPDPASDFA